MKNCLRQKEAGVFPRAFSIFLSLFFGRADGFFHLVFSGKIRCHPGPTYVLHVYL